MKVTTPVTLVAIFVSSTALADEHARHICGRVVDEQGHPVAAADVATFWSANGWERSKIRELFASADGEDDYRKIWSREGDMRPVGESPTKTDANGEFSLRCHERDYKVMVMDKDRRRGGVATLDPQQPDHPVVIRLQPLVRVRGAFRLSDPKKPVGWAHARIFLPEDPNFPLGRVTLARCGSYQARFEFLLPPGEYVLRGDAQSSNAVTKPDKTITVVGQQEIDLGQLELVPEETRQDLIERAKAKGTWGDYRDHYGSAPPRWYAADVRGVAKEAKIEDFKGKWVLLYFWMPNCAPCLGEELPVLAKFYRRHRAQRDEFEILAICMDLDGELESIPDLDRSLESVIENVWGGKPLPFPVLLDNTSRTFESFGLDGTGNHLLIDPQGRLVKGDLETLAAKLK